MKRSVLISAIAIGLYYLLREILRTEGNETAPRTKHLTNIFSKAKEYAVSPTLE